MRSLVLLALIGCQHAAPAVSAPPPVAPVPAAPCPPLDADLARRLAAGDEAIAALDLDGDPATRELGVRACPSSLRCDWTLHAERAGCWRGLGTITNLMSHPGCETRPTGGYCTLSGMRLMIHGDAQQYLFPFAGSYGTETAGSRHVEGPRKR